jgi:hypothetical protein
VTDEQDAARAKKKQARQQRTVRSREIADPPYTEVSSADLGDEPEMEQASDPMLALRGAERIGADPLAGPDVDRSGIGATIDAWLADKKQRLGHWLGSYLSPDDPAGPIARGMMESGGRFPGEIPYIPGRAVAKGLYQTLMPGSMMDLYLSAAPPLKGERALSEAVEAARAERMAGRALKPEVPTQPFFPENDLPSSSQPFFPENDIPASLPAPAPMAATPARHAMAPSKQEPPPGVIEAEVKARSAAGIAQLVRKNWQTALAEGRDPTLDDSVLTYRDVPYSGEGARRLTQFAAGPKTETELNRLRGGIGQYMRPEQVEEELANVLATARGGVPHVHDALDKLLEAGVMKYQAAHAPQRPTLAQLEAAFERRAAAPNWLEHQNDMRQQNVTYQLAQMPDEKRAAILKAQWVETVDKKGKRTKQWVNPRIVADRFKVWPEVVEKIWRAAAMAEE